MPESSKSIDTGKKRVSFDETSASSKKQKIVHGDAVWVVAVEIESKTLEKNKSVNKQESSSDDKQEDEKKVVLKKPVKESSCQESSDKETKLSSEEQSAKKPVSSSSSDDSSDDEEEDVKNRSIESSDDDISSSEENDSDEGEEPKPSSKKQSVVSTAEKQDDVFKNPVEAETKNIITMEECKRPQSLLPPRAAGSKLVCMDNLSPFIKESDVVEFFKDAGTIDWVTFEKEGNRFLGYGHVRFETSEAAQKALKRNGEELIGHAIELTSVMDGTLFDNLTPSSEHKYLIMENLTPDVKESDIIEFFKDAGKVVSVRLRHEGDNFFAHVQFASSTVAHKAIRRNGQKLCGRYVKLFFSTEMTVRDSYTLTSRRPPGFGVLIGQGYGPTKVGFRCNCTLPVSGIIKVPGFLGCEKDQSRCRSCLGLMEEPKKPVATETKAKKKDDSSGKSESEDRSNEEDIVKNRSVEGSDVDSSFFKENDSDEGEDGVSKKPVEAETKNIITMEECNKPQSLLPPRAAGSKLVCMDNLSPFIKERDVVEFFKDAGTIDWVTFEKEGNRFLGYGHVRFETSEAAQKALKRNGEDLIGHAIELTSVMDGTLFDNLTPRYDHRYLVMGNLTPDVKESDIIEFFKDAGKVLSVRLKRHEGDGCIAHVQFASSIVAEKAIQRHGQKLHGRFVKLFFATEMSVWDSYTPSSRTLPGFGVLSDPYSLRVRFLIQ